MLFLGVGKLGREIKTEFRKAENRKPETLYLDSHSQDLSGKAGGGECISLSRFLDFSFSFSRFGSDASDLPAIIMKGGLVL